MVEVKFNYAVGRPWDIEKPDGSIGFYTYGTTTFYGTMDSAVEFKNYCDEQLTADDERGKYRIYKLVEIVE